MTIRIYTHSRIILTIRKHIEPQQSGSRAAIAIRIDEPLHNRVVISALQVIEPGFGVVVVAAVAERVQIGVAAGFGQHIAPGVVGVLGIDCAALVVELHHIALGVEHIMEGVVAGDGGIIVTPHGEGSAGFVIEEVQAADKGTRAGIRHIVPDNTAILRHIRMLQALGDLYAANAGYVDAPSNLPPRGKVAPGVSRKPGDG